MDGEKEEYFCTECKSKVDERDTVCKNCGADLTELIIEDGKRGIIDKMLLFINKFSKYHRISFYLLLAPLLMIIISLVYGIIYLVYYEYFRIAVVKLGAKYLFDYFSYIVVIILYALPIFVFAHLYLKIAYKLKIIITISVVVISYLVSIFFQTIGFNTLGIIPLAIILLEVCFIKYSKKDYIILVIAVTLFLGWFQFLSLGKLPKDMVKKDYNTVSKPLNVLKSKMDFISIPDDYNKYDKVIPYVIYRKKDTLQLLLKYDKIWTKNIPSQKWQLVDWSIDSLSNQSY